MSRLAPVAFDLETTGLGPVARLTVAWFASSAGAWQALNTGGRPADGEAWVPFAVRASGSKIG